jgi:2-phosphosulfolactate phosphatase
MKFSRFYQNRLQIPLRDADTVVVIDVLRAFTTAAVALARGASAVYPVEGVAAANALAGRLESAVTVGAQSGGAPVPGFDFGNSPAALMNAELAGQPVVMTTAAGVQALQRFRHAPRLYAASLVCARATAAAIRAAGAREVCFVITGEWVDRDGDEDAACADYLQALLCGEPVAAERFAQRVCDSDFGRRFATNARPELPAADLELAVQVDRFDFALPVTTGNELLVIRRGGGAGG